MRFILVDRIEDLQPGKSLTGIKCWTMTEDMMEHHFPEHPLVPGTMILESMVQMLGILVEESWPSAFGEGNGGVWSVLTMIRKAKFREPIRPGDRMMGLCGIENLSRELASGRVTAQVDSQTRAEASFDLALIPTGRFSNPELLRRRKAHVDYLMGKTDPTHE